MFRNLRAGVLVVNSGRPNLPREDYDALRAELHRLARAEASIELREPVLGRMAWARQHLAPSRLEKLQRLFERVQFSSQPSSGS